MTPIGEMVGRSERYVVSWIAFSIGLVGTTGFVAGGALFWWESRHPLEVISISKFLDWTDAFLNMGSYGPYRLPRWLLDMRADIPFFVLGLLIALAANRLWTWSTKSVVRSSLRAEGEAIQSSKTPGSLRRAAPRDDGRGE